MRYVRIDRLPAEAGALFENLPDSGESVTIQGRDGRRLCVILNADAYNNLYAIANLAKNPDKLNHSIKRSRDFRNNPHGPGFTTINDIIP